MQKVGIILLLFFILNSCAVKRKAAGQKEGIGKANGYSIEDIVRGNNLTNENFFIEKAEFVIKTGDSERKGIATCKFVRPGNFLISIKSIAGFEIARIYYGSDTIKINDRINKKLYISNDRFLKGRFGLSGAILPALLGDFIFKEPVRSKGSCNDGSLVFIAQLDSILLNMDIDCSVGKVRTAHPLGSESEGNLTFKYRDFITINGRTVPSFMQLYDSSSRSSLELRIIKITVPWEGTIDFVAGRQYEIVNLL